ncbi:MAG: YeiH family protein [Lachnospirales bacterium]
MDFLKKNWKGFTLCLAIAGPSWILGNVDFLKVVGGPVFGIVFGMIVTLFIKEKGDLQPGIAFTSKKILQYAVILLGFGLNLRTIAKVGSQSLPIILSTIATSLIISFILCKLCKIPSKISVLVGVGSSICGGSAVAATAPVIDADDEEIAQAISVIFLFNVVAAIIFPTLGKLIGLSNEGFALFAGTAVNDTSSVTAAASSWESMTGAAGVLESATIVKLTRTLAIIPITLVLAFYQAKTSNKDNNFSLKRAFPSFIIFFVIASIITTVATSFGVSEDLFGIFKSISKFFIILAMAAIGLNTDIVKLIKTGGKPIFMGFCCWVGIALVSLIMQHILGIW